MGYLISQHYCCIHVSVFSFFYFRTAILVAVICRMPIFEVPMSLKPPSKISSHHCTCHNQQEPLLHDIQQVHETSIIRQPFLFGRLTVSLPALLNVLMSHFVKDSHTAFIALTTKSIITKARVESFSTPCEYL